MKKLLVTSLLLVSLAFGHSVESAGAPPAELDPAIAGVLQKEGIRVLDTAKKPDMERWFVNEMPSGGKSGEDAVTLTTVPHGAFLGVVRFPERAADRRGQTMKPGLYTLRFSYYPQDGAHQGAEPQRDFLLMSIAGEDKDPKALPKFEQLVEASKKASGNPHPAVLSFWKVEAADFKAGISTHESDQVLQTKIGDQPVAVIVVGRNTH